MYVIPPKGVVAPEKLLGTKRKTFTCSDGEASVSDAVLTGVPWFCNETRGAMRKDGDAIDFSTYSVRVVDLWVLLRCGIRCESVTREEYKDLKALADYVGDKKMALTLCLSRQLYKALLCEVDPAGIERRLRRLRKQGKAYHPYVDRILSKPPKEYRAAVVRRVGDVKEGLRLWKQKKLLEAAELGVTAACYEWAKKEIESEGDRKQALTFLEIAVRRGYSGAAALKIYAVRNGLEREEALEALARGGCPYAHFYLGRYKIAADEGVVEASYMYALECKGEERIKYLRKAARRSHGEACFLLAMEWKNNGQVTHREAIQLLEKGNTISDEARAEELYQIWKSPKNNRRFRRSLTLASDLGHPLAKAYQVLRICSSEEVTDIDLVKGEKLVEQFEEERPRLAFLCRLCLSKFDASEVEPQVIDFAELDCELGYRFGKWCIENEWALEAGAACLVKGMSDPNPQLAWRSLWYFIDGNFGEEVIERFAEQVIAAARQVLHQQEASFQTTLADWLWDSELEEGRDLAVEVWEKFCKADGYACYRVSVLRDDVQLLVTAALDLNSVDATFDLFERRLDGQKLVADSALYQCLWKSLRGVMSLEQKKRVYRYLLQCSLDGIGVAKSQHRFPRSSDKKCIIS